MAIPPAENWVFYMAFSFFRVAAILQGVYKRSLTGEHGGSRLPCWEDFRLFSLDGGWTEGAPLNIINSFHPGQASSATAESSGKQTTFMANLAWDFATKEGFRIFKELPTPRVPTRTFSTWANPKPFSSRSYTGRAGSTSTDSAKHHLIISPEGLSSRVQELYHKLKGFMDAHVYPAEQLLRDHQASQSRWTPHPLTEELKASTLLWTSSALPLLTG